MSVSTMVNMIEKRQCFLLGIFAFTMKFKDCDTTKLTSYFCATDMDFDSVAIINGVFLTKLSCNIWLLCYNTRQFDFHTITTKAVKVLM